MTENPQSSLYNSIRAQALGSTYYKDADFDNNVELMRAKLLHPEFFLSIVDKDSILALYRNLLGPEPKGVKGRHSVYRYIDEIILDSFTVYSNGVNGALHF